MGERQGAAVLAAVLVIGAATTSGSSGQEAANPNGWETSLALGVNVSSGNSETLSSNARLAAQRKAGEHSLRLSLEGAYGETTLENGLGEKEDQITAQNAKAAVAYRHALDGVYLYTDSAALHDDIAEVDYRATTGVGLGYALLKTGEAGLGVEAGAGYLWEDVAGATDDYLTLRAAVTVERKLSKTSKVWGNGEYVPRADDFEEYLMAGEVGVEAALDSSMNLRFVVQDRYDNRPAPGREKNDLTVISALSWRL